MNANDSVPTELVPQGVSSIPGLAWSPDRSRIAFVKTNRWSNPPTDQDHDQIAFVSAKGADLQTIGPGHHMILGIDWR
jgi:Tol biopolymer transport system component